MGRGQKLRLSRGLAEIAFGSGVAKVVLAAPACLEILAEQDGFLHAGSLTANVPHEAAGFTIRTPTARVVDLGTEFGVAVEKSGRSEVHVFVGSVTVEPQAARGQPFPARTVLAGQAVRVAEPVPGKAAIIEPIAAGGRQFVRSLRRECPPAARWPNCGKSSPVTQT